jgi:D-alanyl-D-alanine carboxypeptidase
MNKRARLLGMERTTYANPHGLSNSLNKSCCLDLALLCDYAMQNIYFRRIVSCKEFTSLIDKELGATESLKSPKRESRGLNYDPEELNL